MEHSQSIYSTQCQLSMILNDQFFPKNGQKRSFYRLIDLPFNFKFPSKVHWYWNIARVLELFAAYSFYSYSYSYSPMQVSIKSGWAQAASRTPQPRPRPRTDPPRLPQTSWCSTSNIRYIYWAPTQHTDSEIDIYLNSWCNAITRNQQLVGGELILHWLLTFAFVENDYANFDFMNVRNGFQQCLKYFCLL